MYAQKENLKESKNKSIADSVTQGKNSVRKSFGVVNNRNTNTKQNMAISTITDYQQAGGSCGLYSLGMAASGVNVTLETKKKEFLERILIEGNNVGTFVGEFMDAENLSKVGANLGLETNVLTFTDETDFTSKLASTGGHGVIMGYSVYDDTEYACVKTQFPTLSMFKHLFSHWSVIEDTNGCDLVVRDPNNPSTTRNVNISAFYRANQDAHTTTDKFSFQEFEDKGVGNVGNLRGGWEHDELKLRAGNTAAKNPIGSTLPETELKLKGKIVTVKGKVTGL